MEWKKVIDSKELIVFERDLNSYKIKIEARLNDDKEWDVYQTFVKGSNSNLIKEFSLKSRDEVVKTIRKLTKEKNPLSKKVFKKDVNIEIKRIFKEELVEKWMFTVSNNIGQNFVFIKYDESVKVDIVMHERYKSFESMVIELLEDRLSLREFSDDIVYDIYYFKKSTHRHTNPERQEEQLFGDVYIQFGIDKGDEE